MKQWLCWLYMIGIVTIGLSTCVYANMTFNTFSSQLIFKNTSSQLMLGKAANVSGWSDLSIVKDYGRNNPSAWTELFASGVVVSQSGGTAVPRTHLIQANSNAVNRLGGLASIPVVSQNSVDGTTYVQYEPNHHIFRNNGNAWTVRGWVRFNNGFTVMPRASVIMDTLTTVSGGMDLRDTGTLILNNDLYLSHAVTLTNGGNIKGKASVTGGANTIFLGGDLTLASTTYARTLHITGDWSKSGTSGDLIIDGCGHTLNIGDRAQIFVDMNVTLTLRNMTIKTGPKSLMKPAIQLASLGSKLALDNVLFDLGADFQFKQGQLFIHDEVAVTGTSAFIYQSPIGSYITSGATWSFEQGTTFSVAPASITDVIYTAGSAVSNNFIVLADASSALSLNGCSLKTTYTGLRLRSGMVLFDNRVTIDTTAGLQLATTGTTPVGYLTGVQTGNTVQTYTDYPIAWSPDGKFLAVVEMVQRVLHIYRFDGTGAPVQVGGSVALVNDPQSVAWSPDGRYVAVAIRNFSGGNVQVVSIFKFSGNSTPTLLGTVNTSGTAPNSVAWSPDGRFFAVPNGNGNTVEIFTFDGVSLPRSLGTVATGTNPDSVSWSPDGRFIAFINANSHNLQVCSFNGRSAPVSLGTVAAGTVPRNCAFSPDGRFIAVTGQSFLLYIYRFNGSSLPTMIGSGTPTGQYPLSVAWAPDGRYIAVANTNDATLQLYQFDGINTPVSLGTVSAGTHPLRVSWSPDGKFIAVYNNVTPTTVHIFRCNYVYTGQPAQGFSNGLVFGDKVQGPAYDANVQLLGGAAVTVNGMVKDDSA